MSEDSDTITVHYETDDIDFLYANDVQLIWSSLGSLGFSSNDKSGKLEIDLKMSKDDGMPVSVTITGVRDSDFYKNQKYVSEVTYSKVNSDIHVDIPSGIDNAFISKGGYEMKNIRKVILTFLTLILVLNLSCLP